MKKKEEEATEFILFIESLIYICVCMHIYKNTY